MNFRHILKALLLALLVVFIGSYFVTGFRPSGVIETTATNTKESAYDRVMRTGTIRCGYFLYKPYLDRDLKTGALYGVVYELMNEIGKQLSLKIDWSEEVSIGTAFDGLKTNRYDMLCFPLNRTPGRARVTEFTDPIFAFPYFLYARVDDTRFDNDYTKVNDPSVKVAILEGEMSQVVKNEDFPKAQVVSLPDIMDIAQVLMQVSLGKADVAMTEPSTAESFMKANPGKLKRVPGPSLRTQPVGLEVGVGEEALKSMLNTTLQALQVTGYIEKVVTKYTTAPDQYYLQGNVWTKSTQPPQ